MELSQELEEEPLSPNSDPCSSVFIVESEFSEAQSSSSLLLGYTIESGTISPFSLSLPIVGLKLLRLSVEIRPNMDFRFVVPSVDIKVRRSTDTDYLPNATVEDSYRRPKLNIIIGNIQKNSSIEGKMIDSD